MQCEVDTLIVFKYIAISLWQNASLQLEAFSRYYISNNGVVIHTGPYE